MFFIKFDTITVPAVDDAIFARLGFRKGKTKMSLEQETSYKKSIDQAAGIIALKGVALRIAVRSKSLARVELENDLVFESHLLAHTVKDCSELLFMGVTAGPGIVDAIHLYEKTDLTKSVVFDAVASEMTDSAFDWMQNYFTQELRRENKVLLNKRISCGYADFSIEYQKTLYALLSLSRIGIEINTHCLLIPEKSATAVTGVH